MDENLNQEALLRHLLSERHSKNDDQFVYSFLLGFRLFLSPHQLLTELKRFSTENATRNSQWGSAGKPCSKCRQLHRTSQDASRQKTLNSDISPNTSVVTESTVSITTRKGTDFGSQTFVSSAFLNINSSNTGENIVDGEDTIRRRRRGRRRIQPESSESASTPTVSPAPDDIHPADRSSTVSRDSGILSAVLELEVLDGANNNRKTTKPNQSKALDSCNDSGYVLDEDLKICSQCSPNLQKENTSNHKRQLLHILHEWVRRFPADFRNKKIMGTLDDIIKGCHNDDELSEQCAEVLDCISRRKATQEAYEQLLSDSDHKEPVTKTLKRRKNKNALVDLILKLKDAADVNEMAQQLCIVEMNFLKHVGAEEFLQLFTADGDEDTRTNLGACVRWFNRLSHLVATVICMCRKRKHGRHVITFFARVADRCFELSNFNSSMAILTGLSLGPVTRLKRTWNKLVLSELSKLQNVFDPSNNFLKYRSIYMSRVGKLHAASPMSSDETGNRYSVISQHSITSAASTSSQPGDSGIECDQETGSPGCSASPCSGFEKSPKKHFVFDPKTVQHDGVMVPFLVLMVKDVYFLNHAITTISEDGSINIEKLRNLAHILWPLEEWKQMSSPYHKRDDLQNFLLHAQVQDDTELYLLSYKREAPTNRFEKQQLKSLRAERDSKKRNDLSIVKGARSKTV